MMFFVNLGYRVVAFDRRGHGRSTQVADGHDMDHYAADAAAVTGTSTSTMPSTSDTPRVAARSRAMLRGTARAASRRQC